MLSVVTQGRRVDANHATLLQVDLHSIFVLQYWPTLQTFSRCQLSKKYLLWNPTVWHTHNVTDPWKLRFKQESLPQVFNTSVLGILSCHLTRAREVGSMGQTMSIRISATVLTVCDNMFLMYKSVVLYLLSTCNNQLTL